MNDERDAVFDAGETGRDEVPRGPAQPADEYPQPVQEVVDPTEPEPLADRERTSVSGYRTPREDE